MVKQIIIFSCLVLLLSALFTSPDEWLEKGFDIRDGVLKDFPNYNLQVDTKCTEVNLNKAGTPYNYNGTVMSGYLKVGKGNSALGFIFYGKENVEKAKLNTIPTVIWLNGGPGSSSQLGNMMELGPFWVVKSSSKPYDVVRNKYAWTNNYNILFVDQPVGTGLSYADPSFPNVYVTNMSQMADDFYAALKELYNNPNGCFQRINIRGDHPLFVFGESYAGKYAPAIGLKIANEAKDNKGFLTGLKGVAIGDGFTHPFSTLSMMGEYAYNFGLIDYQ